MNTFPAAFYEHLRQHTLTGIKGGANGHRFLCIWMVSVHGRVFARSWGKSQQSWFTAMLADGVGQVQFGQQVLNVKGQQCTDATLNQQIDQAYLQRYTTPANVPYAQAISQPEYAAYTMELLYAGG